MAWGNLFRGRLYDVEATPVGASIPAYRLRERAPEWRMSENEPVTASAREPKSPTAEALSLVQQADRARWGRSKEGPRAGAWVASSDGDNGQKWSVEEAPQRRALMDAQSVAAWFGDLVDKRTLEPVYLLIGCGDARSALETLARANHENDCEVPRGYAFALERVGKAHAVDDVILSQVYDRVPAGAQAWAHTLKLPKIRQR